MSTTEQSSPPPAPSRRRWRRGPWRRGRSAYPRRERTLAIAFLVPAVVLVAVLIYFPIGRVIISSVTAQMPLAPGREFVGLERYADLATSATFWNVVRNSVVWTGGVVLLQNVAGLGAALLLNQGLPAQRLSRVVLLIPWVLPGVAAALLWRFIYDPQLGLLNSLLQTAGVIDSGIAWLGSETTAMGAVVLAAVWKGFPFSMVMYLAALQGVQRDHIEAAMMDGAGAWRRFRYVIVPSISGVIRLNLLLTTVFTFNYFDMIWVATRGGPLDATHIFPTYIFQLGFGELQFDQAATYGVVAALILAIAGYLYIKELRPQESV